MLEKLTVLSFLLILLGCAETTVTPVSKNEVLISTSTASGDCSPSATMQVASQMAAVETLRRGYARYVIVDTNSQSTSAIGHIPNYSGTGIGTFYDAGSNEVQVLVRMMGPRDPGFSNGIDAKAALGEEWQALVENGITSCY